MRIISGKARGTKLYTLEGLDTRPTLDRVKESMFNIINSKIPETTVLDLFSGSGAVGLEFASRGAKKVILCDSSKKAIDIINKNIEKTHFQDIVTTYNCDFKEALNKIAKEKIDIIYIDPPYKTDYIKQSIELILKLNCIDENTLIICETDELSRVVKEISELNIKIIDQRKYGRANLIFIKRN
jgi:16S rRNA (guanine966-N2)-methyltransferase